MTESSKKDQTLKIVLKNQKSGVKRNINIVNEYSYKNVSEKVARIILSYTEYVNKFIWKKK